MLQPAPIGIICIHIVRLQLLLICFISRFNHSYWKLFEQEHLQVAGLKLNKCE